MPVGLESKQGQTGRDGPLARSRNRTRKHPPWATERRSLQWVAAPSTRTEAARPAPPAATLPPPRRAAAGFRISGRRRQARRHWQPPSPGTLFAPPHTQLERDARLAGSAPLQAAAAGLSVSRGVEARERNLYGGAARAGAARAGAARAGAAWAGAGPDDSDSESSCQFRPARAYCRGAATARAGRISRGRISRPTCVLVTVLNRVFHARQAAPGLSRPARGALSGQSRPGQPPPMPRRLLRPTCPLIKQRKHVTPPVLRVRPGQASESSYDPARPWMVRT